MKRLEDLDITAMIHKALCYAVELHDDEDDLAGMLEYSRVMLQVQIPGVQHTIVQRCPQLSLDSATMRGDLSLLNRWASLGLPLRCSFWALEEIYLEGLHIGYYNDSEFFVALGLRSPLDEEQFPDQHPSPIVQVDAKTLAACADVASGHARVIQLRRHPVSLNGIAALNNAMASPAAAPISFMISESTVDLPRLFAFKLPTTVKTILVDRLWFGDAKPEDLARVVQWPSSVKRLVFKALELTEDILPCLFSGLPTNLAKFEIHNSRFDADTAVAIARVLPAELYSLHVQNTPINGSVLARMCPHLPRMLKKLVISNAKLGAVNPTTESWAFPPGLTKLSLEYAEMGDHGTVVLAAALPSMRLQSLRLSEPDMSTSNLAMVFRQLPQTLESLNLEGLQLEDAAFRALFSASLNGLKKLKLWDVNFADKRLAQLIRMLPSSLQELNLIGSTLLRNDAHALDYQMPPGLRILQLERIYHQLEGQLLNNESVRPLAARLPPALTKLTLSHNNITDVGAAALAEHLPPALELLDLMGTSITPAGEAAIRVAAPPSLTELHL
ncbi:hypothetical protein H9P43_007151 [Blastocladiella emersonii ATCC 22665]|nr:hypothetical protein H9P43_007151 [Blastocladiella emersonii ATCC 22665]